MKTGQVSEENTLVQMSLVDLNGRVVGIPINDRFEVGVYTIRLDQLEIGWMKSGVYIMKFEVNEKTHYRRIVRQ